MHLRPDKHEFLWNQKQRLHAQDQVTQEVVRKRVKKEVSKKEAQYFREAMRVKVQAVEALFAQVKERRLRLQAMFDCCLQVVAKLCLQQQQEMNCELHSQASQHSDEEEEEK